MKPVKRILLSKEHTRCRLVLAAGFLVAAFLAFGYGIAGLLGEEEGWQRIEVRDAAEAPCAGEFVFQYQLGQTDVSPTAEKKALTLLYTDSMKRAYRLFQAEETFDGVINLAYLNRHPNEVIAVDARFYRALEQMTDHGLRYLYLAPLYDRYDDIFFCNDDAEAAYYDPYLSGEARAEYEELLAYAKNDGHIRLELLGEGQVRLSVSDEYLDFAAEREITEFLDFFWMKNAFIVDFIAEELEKQGYTHGCISSYDGFVRNMDASGTEYAFTIYDREQGTVYPAAEMKYRKPYRIVYLRNYPMNGLDALHYYERTDGTFCTPYIDSADGCYKSAVDSLVAYGQEAGCAEILLSILPFYVADFFSPKELFDLKGEKIYSIYCEDKKVYCNDGELRLDNLFEGEENVRYEAVYMP